ncbi:transporter substrate-binding domain-containing protein [Gilvimarinus sp. SDUM040013]|uniref:Transporter substrate-binding domain-containing protein n=1 Tax=Gilvimarinus gilvus TaxID=3058038 RepID=A0ABU4S029_9GAMM|nr:transporter substrate-binding domain-containing protein [Gilvimarinus sp. SDUM040013]MDO3386061.1 transporter substrate-binding domain-containing protein [Gilvimarinus sp. SDUM040013]MDX6850514.1 transporter substrate-binding domain-containing protein [Gilvimarinus sp. SDUM040013]
MDKRIEIRLGQGGLAVFCWLFIVLLAACGQGDKPPAAEAQASSSVASVAPAEKAEKKPGFVNFVEQGDLDALRQRGVVRLLAPLREYQGLPRSGMPSEGYRELAEDFVQALGLKPVWIIKESMQELMPALLAGEGDLIVDHLTQTKERDERVAFSLPLSNATERLITPASAGPLEAVQDLAGKRVVVPKGSSYVGSLKRLQAENEGLTFDVVPLALSGNPDVVVDKVVSGEFDATVLDDTLAETLSQYRDDFAQGVAVSQTRAVAWAVRPQSSKLLVELNRYLTSHTIHFSSIQYHKDDLPAIKERRTLRMITRNNPASYFMWRGELMGFEYELLREFAKEQGLRLEVEVAPPGVDPIDWLNAGRGDVIAAAMTVTPERAERVAFTRYYNKVAEQLVTRAEQPPLPTVDALAGRTLVIDPQTSYWERAQALRAQGVEFELVKQDASTTELLMAVADGTFDATIADSHLVDIEKRFATNLAPGHRFEEKEHAWAVRQSNPQLLAELNAFLNAKYRGLFFNVVYNKYFKNESRIGKYQGQRLTFADSLSPYDDIVKPLGEGYQFDWRLIVAQMYQESRFYPEAKSHAGATGLLQVMPRTAEELGFAMPFDERSGIEAGIAYLDWTRDRFEEYLPLEERLWFALAAYNAGFGHVQDARRLARQQGWNPDVWFYNVERAMLLLSKKEYYSKARFGYVRGEEPVQYVRNIRDRYRGYLSAE